MAVGSRAVPATAWRRRDAASLVKFLALTPGHQLHREQVMDALWPDLNLLQAAPRLHKAAHYARQAVGRPDTVVLRGEMVSLLRVWTFRSTSPSSTPRRNSR
jgi:DNA-binding SARP family transcriptional activator